jgi:hypothetical protein
MKDMYSFEEFKTFNIGPNLEERLVKDNLNWSLEYSRDAVEEYRKFIYLAVASGHPVTPSVEVDEVWHTHLLFTRNYKEMCDLLGTFIHHGPGTGKKEEDSKFADQYVRTLESYERVFGHRPPEEFWPYRDRTVNLKRLDVANNWIIPVGDVKSIFKALTIEIKQKLTW